MDTQMKRGFLEACVLSAVRGRESYGYRIVRDVPAALGLTESTLYPLLKRLESAGFITVRSAEHNGRLRKYYRITDAGVARIDEFLADRPDVEAVYAFVLANAVADGASGADAGQATRGDGTGDEADPGTTASVITEEGKQS